MVDIDKQFQLTRKLENERFGKDIQEREMERLKRLNDPNIDPKEKAKLLKRKKKKGLTEKDLDFEEEWADDNEEDALFKESDHDDDEDDALSEEGKNLQKVIKQTEDEYEQS